MRVTCEHCQAGYTLPDRKLKPGRRVQFECRHCGQRIVVKVPEQAQQDQPQVLWFVAQPSGGYTKRSNAHVRESIRDGTLAAQTLLWTKGQTEWTAVSKLPMWSEVLAATDSQSDADEPPKTAILPTEAQRQQLADRVGEAPLVERSHGESLEAASLDSVAGAIDTAPDQQAMSLPVVKTAPLATELGRQAQAAPKASVTDAELATKVFSPQAAQTEISAKAESLSTGPRPTPKSERFAPGASPTGTPVDTGGPVGVDSTDSVAWSPATDTYIGPRDRHTFRIGSDKERQSLIAYVELETSLRRQIRRWQWVTLAASAVAAIAIALALYGWMTMRATKSDLKACKTNHSVQLDK
ncbi:MAG TPA: hypothetical protein DCQ06_14235 [Myxococcales bacterium]|mgnify:CR=1 FL=1|nr:hypothetical protein [Myxococcales bacterium]HAN32748.1 hypothetical protein [Myxococcales bacterium]